MAATIATSNNALKLRQQIAQNIRAYMGTLSEAEVAARSAQRGEEHAVSQSTINNVLQEKHSPKLDVIANIATVFGVAAWQLLIPGRAQFSNVSSTKLDKLVMFYLREDDTTRALIDRVIDSGKP